jgi:peroxiredoxin (alkyl hydroperoxide reductase subunit C)
VASTPSEPLPVGTQAPDGTSERALYVIDGDGIVRWSYVSPVGINPGADGILHALEGLS